MKQNKLVIMLLLTMVTASCRKNFLEVADHSQLITEQYVTDIRTTGHYLRGIYNRLSAEFYHGHYVTYPELIADNIKTSTGSGVLSAHYHWAQQAEETPAINVLTTAVAMNGYWTNGYKLIRQCNFVLEKATAYQTSDEQTAANYKAQAYFLRALIHFSLLNVYAQSYNFTANAGHPGIPYVTTADWTVAPGGRQPVGEVYARCIDDLHQALTHFNGDAGNVELVSPRAAKALLAKLYLYMEEYEKAKDIAAGIAQESPLMTIADGYPTGLFKEAPPTEILFHLPPGKTGYYTNYAGRYYQGSNSAIQFRPTMDIVHLLNENPADARKDWVTPSSGNWTITKFPAGLVPGSSTSTGSYYHPVLRSAEMYLTAAEAYGRLNMEDSARFYLNAVRMRADPAAMPVAATGQALMDSICKERRKELSFEGYRMFDLLRWKSGVQRSDALSPDVHHLPYPSNKAIAPLPLLDVRIYGLQQNPGY